jgi:hypothetical protein
LCKAITVRELTGRNQGEKKMQGLKAQKIMRSQQQLHGIQCLRYMRFLNHVRHSHIRFTPASVNSTMEVNDSAKAQPLIYDFVQRNKMENSPLVIFLGWLGAEWKHVEKYSKWYAQCNMNCVSIIPPIHCILNAKASEKKATQYIKQLEALTEVDKSNIVFHVMSGNGMNMYGHMILNEYFKERKNAVRALIADSTPPVITVDRFSRGLIGTMRAMMGQVPRPDVDFCRHWLLTPISESIFKFYLGSGFHAKERIEKFREQVILSQSRFNQMYIYSDKDVIVPAEDVEYFIKLQQTILEEQKQSLAYVEKLHFKDSDHVAHFRKYPYQYSSRVLEFLSLSVKPEVPIHMNACA